MVSVFPLIFLVYSNQLSIYLNKVLRGYFEFDLDVISVSLGWMKQWKHKRFTTASNRECLCKIHWIFGSARTRPSLFLSHCAFYISLKICIISFLLRLNLLYHHYFNMLQFCSMFVLSLFRLLTHCRPYLYVINHCQLLMCCNVTMSGAPRCGGQ